jgi:hypothetical protein
LVHADKAGNTSQVESVPEIDLEQGQVRPTVLAENITL